MKPIAGVSLALLGCLNLARMPEAAGTTGAEFLRAVVPAAPAAVSAGAAGERGSASLVWNPAGILGQPEPALAFTHFSSFSDTAYEQLEGVFPSGPGAEETWAGCMFFSSTYNFTAWNEYGEESGQIDNHNFFAEAAYARDLGWGVKTGAAVKMFETALAGFSSRGGALDLGVRYTPEFAPISAGVALRNLGAMSALEQVADPLPTDFLAGISGRWEIAGQTLETAADFGLPLQGDEEAVFACGAEFVAARVLFLRAGYNTSENLGNLSLGAGICLGNFQLDYAFQPYGMLGNNQRFTLAYRFRAPSRTESPASAEKKLEVADTKPEATRPDNVLTVLPRPYASRVAFFPPASGVAGGDLPWQLTLLNSSGRELRSWTGIGNVPGEIAWDGLDKEGRPVSSENGLQARWGNALCQVPQWNPALRLDWETEEEAFPDVRFQLRRTPGAGNWTMTVWDATNGIVFQRRGEGKELPDAWVWDGHDPAGERVESRRVLKMGLETEYACGLRALVMGDVVNIRCRRVPAPSGRDGILILGVLFDFDRSELKPEMSDKISLAAQLAGARPGADVVCEGHADELGTPEYNQLLSERRARQVGNFMVQTLGIPGKQISFKGFGKTQPENNRPDEAGRSLNRRVEIRLFLPKK